MRYTFTRPATLHDARDLAPRLREADRAEVKAACGLSPLFALPALVAEGREVYAAGVDPYTQRAEIIFGIDPIDDQVAVIWMLSSDVIYDYPVEFTVNSKRIIDKFHGRFEVLTNFIDARNERHIKWLEWLGFKMLRQFPYGAESRPFLEFVSYRPHPCALPPSHSSA
jgi:hypothetical protein